MKHFLGDSQVLHRNGKLQEAEVAYKRAYTGPLQPWDFDPGWFCLKTGGVDLYGYGIFHGQRMGNMGRAWGSQFSKLHGKWMT